MIYNPYLLNWLLLFTRVYNVTSGWRHAMRPWTMRPWDHGTMRPWTMTWVHGTMRPWVHETMRPWDHETMRPWDHETMIPWDHGTMGPWDHGTMRPWYHETMGPWDCSPSEPTKHTVLVQVQWNCLPFILAPLMELFVAVLGVKTTLNGAISSRSIVELIQYLHWV